ncbi:uncharacterized protein LOC112595504 [Melanaphis sacchari]|uniref:uncharacterized protein LOC112595504 n=1 Tax=Melanaphis sacchari TaxID=742174 RepID=UPI000DC1412F|nr:uncharacterized protein LOC112595504 [Melanaphis sacchari]
MSFVFGICLALIGLTYAEVRITNQKELMDVGFNSALNCISQLDINIDTCSELLDDTFNSSDIKYDRCKCFIPCVSKLIGTMDVSEGKWDEKRYKEITALIEIPEWKQEAEVIGKYCKDNINTHCSAGFRLIQCALKHSTMLQNIAKNYMIQKQAEIEAINSATFNDTEDD